MTQYPGPPQAGELSLLDRLPVAERDHLIWIGRQARGLFDRLDVQSAFDAHLDMFEFVVRSGATASMIGRLLSEVGITRKDGSALPSGTISSALSRARERASRSLAAPLADPQHAAIHGKALHHDAARQWSANPCRNRHGDASLGRASPGRSPCRPLQRHTTTASVGFAGTAHAAVPRTPPLRSIARKAKKR